MKYSTSNEPLVCMLTQSTCYKGTSTMPIKGVLWHSTRANNPNLRRYIQPSDDATNKEEMLELLGINTNQNDWNHITKPAGFNARVGKLANGTVTSIQNMPWDYKPWGCGSGPKGSCNNGWIQIEICEDDLTDEDYFNQIYEEACELTAYLCDIYNINPKGIVELNDIGIPTILCHAECYDLGFGGKADDVLHWFSKFGKDMNMFREDVDKLLGKPIVIEEELVVEEIADEEEEAVDEMADNIFKIGDEVKLLPGATYVSGKEIPVWMFRYKLYVRAIAPNGLVVSSQKKGAAIGGIVAPSKIEYYDVPVTENQEIEADSSYVIEVLEDNVSLRSGAGNRFHEVAKVNKYNRFTIIKEKNNWGLLKSKIGWINLDLVKKI